MSGLSVLLVEDDLIDQMAFSHLVQEENLDYDYQLAASVEETTTLLAQRHFDVIVSDYNLGDGTALDVLQLQSEIPLIIVTGAGSEVLAVTAMKAGAYDYLTKDIQHHYLKLLPIVIENTIKRKQAEREALDTLSERVRRESLQSFLQNTSHDLRTVMTVCDLSIHIMSRHIETVKTFVNANPVDVQQIRETLVKMEERAHLLESHKKHFNEIILNMLEMARVDALDSLQMETADFTTVVNNVVESFRPVAAERSQSLIVVPAPHPVMIQCAPNELMKAIQNLLKNALSFTPDGGDVIVTTTTQEQEVRLAITDTGEGISPQHLPHIFDRFYRADGSRNMTYAESGLGLPIARRIVELHHGRIEVTSVPQHGSTFTIRLPL
ncbi:MAG: HAMP domain-containing histidine kinase [Anaerolineaceae bacterium]|nr:HAMP domain-containing histidine kinase [Anaerolineaceae bacterium]